MQIKSLEIATADLAAAKTFYHQILNFPLLDESDQQVSFAAGHSRLSFVKAATTAFYHIAFLIPSNQLVQAFNWVRSKTSILPFTEESCIADFPNWNAEAFYFHDAAQNILEFIVHHDLAHTSETPFSASSIIGICEVGMPMPSVPDACRVFNQQFGIPYYKKGPHLPHFAVMGEEDGLLIVTAIGRGWLPTQRPAEQHPLQVQLMLGANSIRFDENGLLL
jgi:catechol 2,3-dioxygenase-like lactoylglutathione lyase family enzyme